jgi:hypothetical protein
MANEVSDRRDVVFKFLGEGEGRTHEARDPLPQGVVKALDLIGFPCFIGHCCVLGRWNNACVGCVLSRGKGGLLTICRQDVGPQLCCALTTPIANMEGNDLAHCTVHCQPKPLLVRLLLDNAAHFVCLDAQSLDDHRRWRGYGLDIQMVGQSRKAGSHKVHKPSDAHTHHTANPVEGDFLALQAFHEGTVLARHEALSREEHKLATTGLALVVLFAVMDMPMFLELLGSTCWTCLSHDHDCVRASRVSVGDPGQ